MKDGNIIWRFFFFIIWRFKVAHFLLRFRVISVQGIIRNTLLFNIYYFTVVSFYFIQLLQHSQLDKFAWLCLSLLKKQFFWDRVLLCCLNYWPLPHDPSISASWAPGITSIHYHTFCVYLCSNFYYFLPHTSFEFSFFFPFFRIFNL